MHKFISYFLYYFSKIIYSTYRIRFMGNENLAHLQKSKNFIFAIWHQNLLTGILAQTGCPFVVMVSKSKDAEPAAFTCEKNGHTVFRGSSKRGDVDKGGKAAKEQMILKLKSGTPGAITVDGPKGPAFKVKPGIIDMAMASNAAIIPYGTLAESFWKFKSWDQFILPKPFSRIIVIYGKSIVVNINEEKKEEFSQLQFEIEEKLNGLHKPTDSLFEKWNLLSKKNWYEENEVNRPS